jgi:predicted HAD superfamily phosphohydrolase YqeG
VGNLMLHRVPMLVAGDLDELDRLVTAASGPVVLVFDADNTLVPQGASVRVFQRRVIDAIERFEALPAVSRVVVLTNGPDRQAPEVIYRGNKPWTTRKRLGLEATQEAVWVIGDQILTDGLLAWRKRRPHCPGHRHRARNLWSDDDASHWPQTVSHLLHFVGESLTVVGR